MVYTRKENNFKLESGGWTFVGQRNDPYGFWTVEGRKGKEKIKFDGQYTSCDDAVKATKTKLNQMSIPEEEVML